jgi:DNA polymerase-3 subunit epsilon
MYAIVDIETTGGYAAANGITEISIRVFDGKYIVEEFETLVNPEQPIPYYIQRMTGITDDMVSSAPSFGTIAEKVADILKGRIFIAHNVNFDYSFVKAQLNAAGLELEAKKLCTVRLSRKIFPGLPSYSLGNLCHSLGVNITNHHRAGGDTEATLKVFRLLLENDKEEHIRKSLERNSKEAILPPNVPKAHYEQLPYTPGVYYFHNEKGKVVYVGKAINIKYRVNSHFSNNSAGRQKQNFMKHVHGISYRSCGTELMACILESTEIKKMWPAFNSSQKRWEDIYGIFIYEDQQGYKRLAIDKHGKRTSPVYTFHYLNDGQSILRKLVKQHGLCPRLCFLQHAETDCEGISNGYCQGACEKKEAADIYNARVEAAVSSLRSFPSFAIVDRGLNGADQSCVLVSEGKFYGMGYINDPQLLQNINLLKEQLTIYPENSYIRNLVYSYAARFPDKVIAF